VFFRWLHKSWKYFWGILLSLLAIVIIVAGGIIGLLQLDITQDYLSDRIEQNVEASYQADLSIGDLDGFLPFRFELHDVTLARKDSVVTDTIATVKNVSSKVDIWGLLLNKITITGFSVEQPQVQLRSDERGKLILLDREKAKVRNEEPQEGASWLANVEILAPEVNITDGAVRITSETSKNQIGNLPQSLSISDINSTLFVDWATDQRYLDIENFSAQSPELKARKLRASGQVYNDYRFLEFNSFYVTLGNSQLILNGEIDGVNILQPDVTEQVLTSAYDLNIRSEQLYPSDLGDFIPKTPTLDTPFTLQIDAEGTTDSLWVDQASVGMEESTINFDGSLKNLRNRQTFNYDIRLDRASIDSTALVQLFGQEKRKRYQALENVTLTGKANGRLDSVDVDLDFSGPIGTLNIQAKSQLKAPYNYMATMRGAGVDLNSFSAKLDSTFLNFNARLEGVGITLEDAVSEFQATVTESKVDNIDIELLEFKSSLVDGLWSQQYTYKSGDENLSGSGWVDFSKKEPPLTMRGNAKSLDISKFFSGTAVATSQLNFDYNVRLQGLNPNRIHGRANLDVKPSLIGEDSVRAHQFYVDLNSPEAETRIFRLTSSLGDMSVSGQLVPGDIAEQFKFWRSYLKNRFRAEILMCEPVDLQSTDLASPSSNVVIDGDIRFKDLGLIKKYLPNFPTIVTDSRINFNINTDGTRLLASAEMQADTLRYNKLNFSENNTQVTASFRSDRRLSEFSSVDFETTIGALETQTADLDSMGVDFSFKQDSIEFSQYVGSISDNARFQLALNSGITDSSITVSTQNFFLGNKEYAWINKGAPSLTYRRNGNIDFHDFIFQNRDEYFQLQGTLSKNRSDSLTYVLRDISLNRISDLIKGKIDFSGTLNGTLVTRSLARQPTIQGALGVDHLKLNDRLIGDVSFDSRYKPAKQRFDTHIDIRTDSTKYQDYLTSNDGIGQDIQLDGYFVTPDPEVKQDTVFYFDADFNQIDMWVLPLVVENVFSEMEGQATGSGYVTGNLDDFDFQADFETKNVFAKPQFLNTNYFISGDVKLDRDVGVTFDSLNVIDTKGGTGMLTGSVDFNDFSPITYLDLTLEMDRLQFLNSKFDPDVPFYGNASGTGIVRLTGSNQDLYMRTEDPMQVTSDSEVSIPLLEETELQETGKFIRFVDTFEDIGKKKKPSTEQPDEVELTAEERLREAIRSMTFTERFDLDLQFESTNNVTVNLIFDPVTGEILTAQGNGQVRITMQDQEVQMFGRYNINSGNYQFVTGEIISRRLELEPGGTITWEGPPDNARLDISAIYHARPNINTLTAERTEDTPSATNGGQRVPIDLIVEIQGTLNSVENNYYFRLPTSLDLSSSSTLQYTINQINRDEQQKLLQATSILFTGQFIATQGTGSATASLSQSLTRGSTVLNPLLSNQVISPLLSSQINALLNSDVSRLDIDFNLNAYNQVDLGIALRLYNDRLILRREGQITGSGTQTTLGDRIGDLNATYRIRRGLSLTAFHRQDQVLNSLQTPGTQTGDVAPTVDGIGLEARLQFNTWKELLNNVNKAFKKLFGGEDDNDSQNNNNRLAEQEAKREEESKNF